MKSFQLARETAERDVSTLRWRASTVALLLALVICASLQFVAARHDANTLEFVANVFVIPCTVGIAAILSGYNLAKRRTVQNWVEFATSALLIAFLLLALTA